MALAACVRALFLPGAWPRGPARRGARLRSAALGRATTGGGVGARRAMSHRVLVEAGPAAGVAVLKFRNPPVNALSLEMLTELVISLEKLENDKAIRGVVITAENPGIFLAGLDLVELCGQNPAHYAEYWEAVQELWLRLYQSNKVLVAAINVQGYAGEHYRAPRRGAGPAAGNAVPTRQGPPGGHSGPGGSGGAVAEHSPVSHGPVAGHPRSCSAADEDYDAEADRGPAGEAEGGRHPELCQLHLTRLHPEGPTDLPTEAQTKERLRVWPPQWGLSQRHSSTGPLAPEGFQQGIFPCKRHFSLFC
ncbi:enoyl-CoA delta isomerase 1, mitochondrial isoform 2-T2 [Dugong dugon]